VDREDAARVELLEMRAVVTNTIMKGPKERKALARRVAREMGIER